MAPHWYASLIGSKLCSRCTCRSASRLRVHGGSNGEERLVRRPGRGVRVVWSRSYLMRWGRSVALLLAASRPSRRWRRAGVCASTRSTINRIASWAHTDRSTGRRASALLVRCWCAEGALGSPGRPHSGCPSCAGAACPAASSSTAPGGTQSVGHKLAYVECLLVLRLCLALPAPPTWKR